MNRSQLPNNMPVAIASINAKQAGLLLLYVNIFGTGWIPYSDIRGYQVFYLLTLWRLAEITDFREKNIEAHVASRGNFSGLVSATHPVKSWKDVASLVGSDHQYADRPSMRKFDKQTPFMEKTQKEKTIFNNSCIPSSSLDASTKFQANSISVCLKIWLFTTRFSCTNYAFIAFDLKKTKFLLAHTNAATLLKLAPRALDFRTLAPATIF